GGQPGTVTVRINNGIQENLAAPAGTAFSRVRAFGGAGDDDIQVAGGVTLPTALFGGTGNDRLKAGNGGGICVGGDGDDLLIGGIGRDVLVGGFGADRLVGNGGDDILIAGSTKYDNDPAALDAIMAEWASAGDYATRTQHLSGPVAGLNVVN